MEFSWSDAQKQPTGPEPEAGFLGGLIAAVRKRRLIVSVIIVAAAYLAGVDLGALDERVDHTEGAVEGVLEDLNVAAIELREQAAKIEGSLAADVSPQSLHSQLMRDPADVARIATLETALADAEAENLALDGQLTLADTKLDESRVALRTARDGVDACVAALTAPLEKETHDDDQICFPRADWERSTGGSDGLRGG